MALGFEPMTGTCDAPLIRSPYFLSSVCGGGRGERGEERKGGREGERFSTTACSSARSEEPGVGVWGEGLGRGIALSAPCLSDTVKAEGERSVSVCTVL